jgi:alpha-galactosidase
MHQVGDWLDTNGKFPQGLVAIAEAIHKAGLIPGLWLAPVIAHQKSDLFKFHPDWFLRDEKGKLINAGYNPGWSRTGHMFGLDATNPGFQQALRQWIRTVVKQWGFRYLKLDFLYGACMAGIAYDRSFSPAQRLQLVYDIIRQEAGPDVYILGCGAPMSASVGYVDGMRISCDVAPYWFDPLRQRLTRDSSALSVAFAIRNIFTRAQMNGMIWANDPDCMMVRHTETQLSAAERRSLANALILSGGLCFFSDNLPKLGLVEWSEIREIVRLARSCQGRQTWALDYMQQPFPELIYNHQGYLGIFNFKNQRRKYEIDLTAYLANVLGPDQLLVDAWSGKEYRMNGYLLTGINLEAHASLLLKVAG